MRNALQIAGFVIFNVVCLWILFLGGAGWLEGSFVAQIWPFRRFGFRADAPDMTAGFFKLIAGAFLAFELVVAIIAAFALV
jgi:hypothetical protein